MERLLIKFKTPEGFEYVRIITTFPKEYASMEEREIIQSIANNQHVINLAFNQTIFTDESKTIPLEYNLIEYLNLLARSPMVNAMLAITPQLLTFIAEALDAFARFYRWPDLYSIPAGSIIKVKVSTDDAIKVDGNTVYVEGEEFGKLEWGD